MSKAFFTGLLAGLCWLIPPPAHAQVAGQAVPPPIAANVVRSYFDAFRRFDRGALGRVTAGEANARTVKMLDTIKSEADRHNVGVELKVKDLHMTTAGPVDSLTPVGVKFDIQVVAKKWFFSKVAKVLHGQATFFVGKNLARGDITAPKIVGIEIAFD
jgi:hypothetical protein